MKLYFSYFSKFFFFNFLVYHIFSLLPQYMGQIDFDIADTSSTQAPFTYKSNLVRLRTVSLSAQG